MADNVVGIDIVARLDAFRSELAKIPEIGGKEAKQLATQLSREIKAAERASRSAAQAARAHAEANKGLAASLLKVSVSVAAILQGARLLARGLEAATARMVELDTAAGGDLKGSLDSLRASGQALMDGALLPMVPLFADLVGGINEAIRAVTGLDAAQRQMASNTDAGRAAINAQSEQVEDLRAKLAILKDAVQTDITGAWTAQAREVEASLNREIAGLKRLKGELGASAGLGGSPKAAPAASAAGGGAPARAAPSGGGGLGAAMAESSGAGIDALHDLEDAIRSATMATLEGEAQIRAAGEARKASIQSVLDQVVSSSDLSAEVQVEAIREAGAAILAVEAETQSALGGIRQQEHDAEIRRIGEVQAARQAETATWIGVTSSAVSAISDLVNTAAGAAVEASGKETKERKKAAKIAWGIQSAMAIAQAAVNVPLAISNAIGNAPNPVVGAVMGIIAGIAAGAALAATIAKAAAGPQFHSGGLAPDEQPATLLAGEGVLNRQAVRDIGEQGVRALNRGDAGGGPVVVVNKVGHRTMDVWTHESLRRRSGPLWDAIRATQPRSGTYIPGS